MKLLEKSLTHGILFGAIMTATTMQSGNAPGQQASDSKQNDVTAIDILLDPDATMIQHATAANAQLRQNYPKGFTLGGAHAPHVSLLQRYVKTADLPKVFAAADKVFAKENPISWK
ncbi:MAG TPA: hypothetical protein VK684_13735, partial [Edaphobacter sp.]|nr:hypothetical protein [Edaphobacter sp.]